MISCLIVDDEPLAREVIRLHLSRFSNWTIIGECKTALEAMEALIHHKIEVIFLDIQMPKIKGTDFLRSLKDPPQIVFTTAYPDFAIEGFDLNAVDYLLKPITFERFQQAITKIEKLLKPDIIPPYYSISPEPATLPEQYIFIKQNNRQVKVIFEDVLFLEAKRDFTQFQLRDRKLLAGFHLKMLEGMLPSSQFMRIHRSYIVRLHAIDAVYRNTVDIGGFQVPVSSAHKDELAAALKL